jgi:hypothetical protein
VCLRARTHVYARIDPRNSWLDDAELRKAVSSKLLSACTPALPPVYLPPASDLKKRPAAALADPQSKAQRWSILPPAVSPKFRPLPVWNGSGIEGPSLPLPTDSETHAPVTSHAEHSYPPPIFDDAVDSPRRSPRVANVPAHDPRLLFCRTEVRVVVMRCWQLCMYISIEDADEALRRCGECACILPPRELHG